MIFTNSQESLDVGQPKEDDDDDMRRRLDSMKLTQRQLIKRDRTMGAVENARRKTMQEEKQEETMQEVFKNLAAAQDEELRKAERATLEESGILIVDKRRFMVLSSLITLMDIIICAMEVDAKGKGDVRSQQVAMFLHIGFMTYYNMEWMHRCSVGKNHSKSQCMC